MAEKKVEDCVFVIEELFYPDYTCVPMGVYWYGWSGEVLNIHTFSGTRGN